MVPMGDAADINNRSKCKS